MSDMFGDLPNFWTNIHRW